MASDTIFPSIVMRIILTIAVAVTSCQTLNDTEPVGNISRHRRIASGFPTDRRHYPYIVSIQMEYGYHGCAGTIISGRVILTAGHCASRPKSSSVVMVGQPFQRDYPNQYYRVANVYRHEKYSVPGAISDAINDISLITLQIPIQFHAFAQKVNLIGRHQRIKVGSRAIALGWGAVREPQNEDLQGYEESSVASIVEENWLAFDDYRFDNGSKVTARVFPRNLQGVSLTVISRNECLKRYRDPVHESHVCAYSPGKGGCFKDSGGPLMIDGVQVGVYCGGKRCGKNPGYPNLYTNILFFLDWIDEKMRLIEWESRAGEAAIYAFPNIYQFP